MPDAPPAAVLERLTEDERDGLELLLDAARDSAYGPQKRALPALAAAVYELARRRAGEDRAVAGPATLDAARRMLRDHVIAAIDALEDESQHGRVGDLDAPAELAGVVRTLVDAYVTLGGNLELASNDDRDEELDDLRATLTELRQAAARLDVAVTQVGEHGRQLLTDGVLEPLGTALRAFYEHRAATGAVATPPEGLSA